MFYLEVATQAVYCITHLKLCRIPKIIRDDEITVVPVNEINLVANADEAYTIFYCR